MGNKQYWNKVLLVSLGCLLIIFFACSKEDVFVGTYKSTEKNLPEYSDILLELKPDGRGIRWVGDEKLTVHWEPKGEEIRIQTRSGGIIIAKMQEGVLEISLPGAKKIYLEKIE